MLEQYQCTLLVQLAVDDLGFVNKGFHHLDLITSESMPRNGTSISMGWCCDNACFLMRLHFLQHIYCSTVYIQYIQSCKRSSVSSIGIRCSSSKRVTTSVCATAGMFYCSMLRQHIQLTCKIQLKLLPAKRLMYPRITLGDMRLKQFLPKQPQSPSLSDVTTASVVGAASSPLYVSLSPAK